MQISAVRICECSTRPKLLLDEFSNYKSCMGVDFETFSNFDRNEYKASIFWDISDIPIYKDIQLRSSIDFSKDVDLLRGDFLLWLHKVSIELNSKIYIDIEIPDNPLGFSPALCIDGKTRKIVFDTGDVFEDPEFAHCEPIIDMSKNCIST